jgi:hypothetical protein
MAKALTLPNVVLSLLNLGQSTVTSGAQIYVKGLVGE